MIDSSIKDHGELAEERFSNPTDEVIEMLMNEITVVHRIHVLPQNAT